MENKSKESDKSDSLKTIRHIKEENIANGYFTNINRTNNKDIKLNLETQNIQNRFHMLEWKDVLKNCGITNEDYIRFTKTKMFYQLIEVSEYLFKVVLDKSQEINILSEEYQILNDLNNELNNNNIELNHEYYKILNKNDKLNSNFNNDNIKQVKGDTGADSSTLNNISKLHNQYKTNYKLKNKYANTLESITSSEFRYGMNNDNNDYCNDDNSGVLDNLAIQINNYN